MNDLNSPLPSGPRADRGDDDRVERAFRRARRHSGRVRFLKLVLPVLAVLIIGGFVARSWVASSFEEAGIGLEGVTLESGRIVMANPTLDGYTGDNRAYSVRADRAIQDIGGMGRIDLEGIIARLEMEDGSIANVEAATGTFDEAAGELRITSELTVAIEGGMTARFASADIDVNAGTMTTPDPVEVDLSGTRVNAESMAVTDNGAVIVFDRRVRVQMDPRQMQSAAGGGENGD